MKNVLTKIRESLLWPFAELAGWAVMRDLSRRAENEHRLASLRKLEVSAQHAGITLRST